MLNFEMGQSKMKGRGQKCPPKKDVIRVKAKKYESSASPETKVFSVDPELTNFTTLRELLIKAFNIKRDFVVSYLVTADRSMDAHYLPMLSEWDYNTAVYAASDPHLVLKIDMRPHGATPDLEEWDIIDDDDMSRFTNGAPIACIPVIRESSTDKMEHQQEGRRRSWFSDRSDSEDEKVFKRDQSKKVRKPKWDGPMTEAEFKTYLDAEGRLLDSIGFRQAVYRAGLDPNIRHSVWPHLLDVYPEELTAHERSLYTKRLCEKYECLKESWQRRLKSGYIDEELRLVANSVRKDVIRTDRTHPFYSGDEDGNANLMALFNILTTYALAHPEVSYCQGMSDLASPLLNVMKDEATTYLCFCALMRRMRENFSCDGWTMTRKFHHLSELVKYYDPTFFEYLREMHSDDLLFAYRWLLLELKREFKFDEVLLLMEVGWASLPSTVGHDGCELDLYDVDLTAVRDDDSSLDTCQTLHEWTVSTTEDEKMGNAMNNDNQSINTVRSRTTPFVPIASPSAAHSCPGMLACAGGVCPALVVRSLMLDQKESKRLHQLRHDSFPSRPLAKLAFGDDANGLNGVHSGRRISRFTIGCLTDDLKLDVPMGSAPGNSLAPILDDTSSSSDSEGEEETSSEKSGSAVVKPKQDNRKSYLLRPSPELKVSDSSDSPVECVLVGQPVPMAADAYLDFQSHSSADDDGQNELTLTRIHEICLANIPVDDSAVQSSKSSSCVSRRSREPSGGQQQSNSGQPALAFTVTDVSHVPTRRSSISNTGADSGIFELAHHAGPSQPNRTGSVVMDVNEFVNVDRDPTVSLPPPHELGDGSPFVMFLCLTIILQHRDAIMKTNLDFNEIAVYFDKLARKHDVQKVLKRARVLYANYLQSSMRVEEEESRLGISKAMAVSNFKYTER